MRYSVFITGLLCAMMFSVCSVHAREEQPASALQKQYAYRARILPRLMQEGFGSPKDFQTLRPVIGGEDEYGYSRSRYDDEQSKLSLADATRTLEAFVPFTNTLPKIERVFFDASLPRDLRNAWFAGVTRLLCEASFGVYSTEYRHISSNDKVAESMAVWLQAEPERLSDKQKAAGVTWEQRIEAADMLLSHLIDYIEEEAPLKTIAAYRATGRPAILPWDDKKAVPSWFIPYSSRALSQPDYGRAAQIAGMALVANWKDETFRNRAEELLSSGKSMPVLRLGAVSLIASSPTENLDDALAAVPYGDGIASFASCWESMGRQFIYGLTPGGCEDNLLEVLQQKALSGHIIVSGEQRGAGIALEKLPSRPTNFTGQGPLYILAANRSSFPSYLRIAAGTDYNAMTGTLLAGMNGPRLIPVDPRTDQGALLLNWAVTVGGPQNKAVIVASDDDPLALAKRMAAWHLALWEKEQGKPAFVFNRACSGSFLRAFLPQMKGEAAALFMGREKGIWFASPSLGGVTWYKAAPEAGLAPLDGARLPSTLELSHDILRKSDAAYAEDARFFAVNELANEHPKPGKNAAFAERFFANTMMELAKNAVTKGMNYDERKRATMALWLALETPKEKDVRTIMFAPDGKGSVSDRIYAAEKKLEGREE